MPQASTPTITFKLGDHLKIKRRLYYHHGIYIGDNKVIHYAPPPGKGVNDGIGWRQILGADSQVNLIHISDLQDFEADGGVTASIEPYEKDHAYPPLKVVARARSRLGENGYNLWGNNCSHFALWCKHAQHANKTTPLWESIWEGAMLGLGAGSQGRQWATMAAGAGLGALAGATRHWLRSHRLPTIYGEFAAYATALYFSLTDQTGDWPFGRSFLHISQIKSDYPLKAPEYAEDQDVLFVYRGGFLRGSIRHNWLITERAAIHPGRGLYVDFHSVAAISHNWRMIFITDLDGNQVRLPIRYADAGSVAKFLKMAVSGKSLEAGEIRRNLLGRVKDLVIKA